MGFIIRAIVISVVIIKHFWGFIFRGIVIANVIILIICVFLFLNVIIINVWWSSFQKCLAQLPCPHKVNRIRTTNAEILYDNLCDSRLCIIHRFLIIFLHSQLIWGHFIIQCFSSPSQRPWRNKRSASRPQTVSHAY